MATNAASRRVMEKCGLRFQGELPMAGTVVAWYAIDRADWPTAVIGLVHSATLMWTFGDAWPSGLLCPWTRGTVDTVACRETAVGKRWSQRSWAIHEVRRPRPAQVPGWLVGACGWGSGMPGTVRPDPSTLGAVGERGSRHERAACSSPQAGLGG
jgi:hypothetical protein